MMNNIIMMNIIIIMNIIIMIILLSRGRARGTVSKYSTTVGDGVCDVAKREACKKRERFATTVEACINERGLQKR